MIHASNINKKYGQVQVLKGIDFSAARGEIVSIVGASGAGKSTLLHILGTLEKPDSGEVLIENTNVTKLSDKALSAFRNQKIGFVFQFHHLLPEFSALENICLPAFIAGIHRNEAEKKAHELLDFLNLSHRATHKPAELSGGEQQRVAIARALINQPQVVLADEPTGNLDSENAAEIHQLILELRKAFNQTFVIVTHNQELAAIADRGLVMQDGLFV